MSAHAAARLEARPPRRAGWVPQPTVTLVGAVVVGVLLLILAAERFHAAEGTAVDQRVLAWMVAHRSPRLTSIATTITTIGSPGGVAIIAAACCAVLWRRARKLRPVVTLAATVATAGALSTIMKIVVGSMRPPAAVQLISETDYGFPSGHVTATLTLVGMLVVLGATGRGAVARYGLATAAGAAVAIIAATRLYLGVHWLSDIIGGVLLGSLVLLAGNAAWRLPSTARIPAQQWSCPVRGRSGPASGRPRRRRTGTVNT